MADFFRHAGDKKRLIWGGERSKVKSNRIQEEVGTRQVRFPALLKGWEGAPDFSCVMDRHHVAQSAPATAEL